MKSVGRTQSSAVTTRTYFVEDNATIRDNLVATLRELAQVEPLGYAETESAALEWLALHADWQLLVVDLWLRQGSGLGVLRASRQRQPHQRVVVLSNYATPDMRKRCAELGADAVFDKSNEIEALVDYCAGLAA
jgi:DNA-binding NarL/FixJ family response regulator